MWWFKVFFCSVVAIRRCFCCAFNSVVNSLNILFQQCGPNLKPFLPQLQMTFTKALNDVNRSVRLRAADALGKLVVIHTRVDPLFVELVAALKAADDTSVR